MAASYNFSYKKPKGVPHLFDEEKQAAFITHYDELKSSLSPDEPLLFMDAVHPTQTTKITAGWVRKGEDKPIKTTGSKTRINVVGAIRLGHLQDAVVKQYAKTVNGESIVDFLNEVRATYQTNRPIHLVLDGAGYHRNKLVIDEAEKLNITLHYLHPYSPNLNPIERLWKVMNTREIANIFRQQKNFDGVFMSFLQLHYPILPTRLTIQLMIIPFPLIK